MAISAAHAGRTYPPSDPYLVTATKVAEFATAVGDPSPAYTGEDAIAPPTFAALVSATAWQHLFTDPELDLALRRIVHGDQRFAIERPLRVGDRITATLTIDKVRSRGGADIIYSTVRIETVEGELVCTASATFFHNREDAA